MKKKLIYNTMWSLILQTVTIICGLILPRQILQFYGSEVNGLVSSITQFLSFISFLQLGVGAVAQSAWYKPLAQKNKNDISKIYVSTQFFFRRISFIFILYVLILCLLYPFKVINKFSQIYTITLIIAIAINLFLQYFLGITNQLLLYADQNAYIYMITQTILLIFNTIISIIMMNLNTNIQIVKLISSLIFSINPLILSIYVKKKYNIDKNINISEEPLKQKWNGFAQHLSSVIMDNTDVAILTIFSTLTNVSIYYIYHLVVYGIRQLVSSVSVGVQAVLGNYIALNKEKELNIFFEKIELLFHLIITFLYSCTIILITTFVNIYTRGINDANYNKPLFAALLTLSFAIYCYRIPYNTIVKAAGHYKQTQLSAILESILNLLISTILVIKYGLIGVAIGTLISVIYRLLYYIIYLSKNILKRKISKFIKLSIIDALSFIICIFLSKFSLRECYNYFNFLLMGIKIAILCLSIIMIIFTIFNFREIKTILNFRKEEKT